MQQKYKLSFWKQTWVMSLLTSRAEKRESLPKQMLLRLPGRITKVLRILETKPTEGSQVEKERMTEQ
jgi:hypothetical protein